MKTKYIGIIIALFGIINACSKSEEEVYSTELKFPEFINVEVLNAMAVSIEYGEEQKIVVTGSEETIKDVITEVISETLIIDQKNNNSEVLSYKIVIPEIREVKNNSIADIEILDFEQEGYLTLFSTNSGNINLGQFDNLSLLNVALEGNGSIYGNKDFGSLKDLSIKNSGVGEYKSFTIKAKNVIVEINNSGSCSVSVTQQLTAIINGSGSVYYKGNPEIISSVYGTGSVVNAN